MVDCMIALPGQLFYSTQIPACLWFLARNKGNGRFRDRRREVLFIDARKLGHMVDRRGGGSQTRTSPRSPASTMPGAARRSVGYLRGYSGILQSRQARGDEGTQLRPHARDDMSARPRLTMTKYRLKRK